MLVPDKTSKLILLEANIVRSAISNGLVAAHAFELGRHALAIETRRRSASTTKPNSSNQKHWPR